MKELKFGKETNCVHGIINHEKQHDGVNSPVHTSSAYNYIGDGPTRYPRYFNTVNQQEIVQKLCLLEGGQDGLVLSSGMAAVSTALFGLLSSGDHVIITAQLYGGTFNLVNTEFPKYNIDFSSVDGSKPEEVEAMIQQNTKVIFIETPSNPLLSIVDIEAIARIAKKHNITTIIDNTFASPINQNPVALGIDVVVHSGTKYLGGHSDLCFGAIITSKAINEKIYKSAINYGGSINAMDSYLIDRSLKTLALRVARQNENAMQLANFLDSHRMVKRVYYPGLSYHEGHQIAKRQMTGFGGILAFEINVDDLSDINNFLDQLTIIQPAISLGGVDTIICSPAQTSHIKMPKEERLKIGVTDTLLRLSVGVEEVSDLMADLKNALEKMAKGEKVSFSVN